MKYGDHLNLITELNTGASTPDKIALLTKLVLGKIARHKLNNRIKIASLATGGLTSFRLGSASYIPDFMQPKLNAGDNNKWAYYYPTAGNAFYFKVVPYSVFARSTEGGVCCIEGNTLRISVPHGEVAPSTIYFPYYSKYLVLDEDGTTEKEMPENNDDEFLFGSEYDDVLVEGVMLYISRREKSDAEYAKAVKEWEKRLAEITFFS